MHTQKWNFSHRLDQGRRGSSVTEIEENVLSRAAHSGPRRARDPEDGSRMWIMKENGDEELDQEKTTEAIL